MLRFCIRTTRTGSATNPKFLRRNCRTKYLTILIRSQRKITKQLHCIVYGTNKPTLKSVHYPHLLLEYPKISDYPISSSVRQRRKKLERRGLGWKSLVCPLSSSNETKSVPVSFLQPLRYRFSFFSLISRDELITSEKSNTEDPRWPLDIS